MLRSEGRQSAPALKREPSPHREQAEQHSTWGSSSPDNRSSPARAFGHRLSQLATQTGRKPRSAGNLSSESGGAPYMTAAKQEQAGDVQEADVIFPAVRVKPAARQAGEQYATGSQRAEGKTGPRAGQPFLGALLRRHYAPEEQAPPPPPGAGWSCAPVP